MQKKRKKSPQFRFRQELFWDVDPKTIDTKKHARYIIERILDFGDIHDVGWLARRYSAKKIRAVIALPRAQIHKKSKVLWSLVFQNNKR
ncbi:hypothetical protein HY627_02140 [Candidatus Uhrbacteria bacterium]|nr:hypothetical protein [Candidatus Uhrbacteria bacterium]